ncbi:MAG: HAMP domain-containing protein [Bradyrhizobiaceae bacterium]|nr:HAMP domain-containing protein [Bradyrhizobiaceae bacterium]
MTALGKLLRTTAFQLTLVYLAVFALFAAFLLGYFAFNTRHLINEQIATIVDDEVQLLGAQYNQAGIRRLVNIVDARVRRPGSSLYLVTTPIGEGLVGNVASLEPGVLESEGWVETAYRRLEEPESAEHNALVRVVRLPGGIRLLVGRDLDERERMFRIITLAGRWSGAIVIVLGILGGLFVSRRVLRRVDAMTGTAKTIMAGDLSGRLPVIGSGDEFDRLAFNLNDMLTRIESLMRGLKEVTDNIAHDLKTPLTRLRNRCEEALRKAKSEVEFRRVMEQTIEESEGLIRTFDALLMIARAESGEVREGMAEFDAAEVARDVSELYEPLAEDKGLTLEVDAWQRAAVNGNRELVSQALANLVDNAIKYAAPAQMPAPAAVNGNGRGIRVSAGTEADRIVLTVSDHGPGIPTADRSRVIDRFVRLEQSRSLPGSGLGLSLVSAVARLHGGELLLEDNEPGLKAAIMLPRAAVPPQRAA